MRAERLQREYHVEVRWEPFEIHPEIPRDGIPMSDAMRQARAPSTERLRALAEDAGIEMRPLTLIPNSRLALEAAEFAREQDLFGAFHRSVFSALFGHDRNIGDLQVLLELASDTGMDVKALEGALTAHRYQQRVLDGTARARQQGIGSTPTFIFDDRFELVGAQEYSVFENVAQRMGAKRRDNE